MDCERGGPGLQQSGERSVTAEVFDWVKQEEREAASDAQFGVFLKVLEVVLFEHVSIPCSNFRRHRSRRSSCNQSQIVPTFPAKSAVESNDNSFQSVHEHKPH